MTFPLSVLGHSFRRAVAGCGLVSVLVSARASAEEQVELEWQAPPECPQRAAVQQKLRSLAGEAWRTTERVSAKGRIEHLDRRYRLTLSVRDGATVKERTIESESCVDLGGAAAVTLGLLLGRGPNNGNDASKGSAGGAGVNGTPGDGTTGGPGTETTPQGDANERRSGAGAAGAAKANQPSTNTSTKASSKDSASKSSDADDQAREDDASSNGAASTRAWRVLLRAPVLTLDLFRLPKPSVGVGAGFGIRYAEWRLLATGRILSDQTLWSNQYPTQFPQAGVRVSRVTGELSACRGWRNGSLELSPCVTVGVDHLTARGDGPPNIARQTQRSTAALLGAAAAAHLYVTEWLAIFAGAGFAVATSHPTFTIQDLGEIGHVGAVQLSTGIGSEWIF